MTTRITWLYRGVVIVAALACICAALIGGLVSTLVVGLFFMYALGRHDEHRQPLYNEEGPR